MSSSPCSCAPSSFPPSPCPSRRGKKEGFVVLLQGVDELPHHLPHALADLWGQPADSPALGFPHGQEVMADEDVKTDRELVAVPRVGSKGGRDEGRERDVGGVQDELAAGEAVEEDEEGPKEGEEVGLLEAGREGGGWTGIQDLGTGENQIEQ